MKEFFKHCIDVQEEDGWYLPNRLTEKQYNNIYLVTGEPDYHQERVVGINSHIMI